MSSVVVSVPEEDSVVVKYIPSDSSVSVEAQVVVIHPENVRNILEVLSKKNSVFLREYSRLGGIKRNSLEKGRKYSRIKVPFVPFEKR